MNNGYPIEIVGCHHENGEITKVKYNTGAVVTMDKAVQDAKENKISNFTASYDNRLDRDVLRGRREVVENGRLYGLPRF